MSSKAPAIQPSPLEANLLNEITQLVIQITELGTELKNLRMKAIMLEGFMVVILQQLGGSIAIEPLLLTEFAAESQRADYKSYYVQTKLGEDGLLKVSLQKNAPAEAKKVPVQKGKGIQ